MAFNDLFLRACRCEPVEMTPVWMMRQAGRFLKTYRALRKKADFLTMCKTPELAAQATMLPINELGVDAAILFSDILIPVEAMGMELDFTPAPVFPDPIRSKKQIEALCIPDPEETVPYVLEAIRILRRELEGRVPLIGFSGAPFTLATYMIEGGGSKNFIEIKNLMYQEPELFASLMDKITETDTRYLNAQIAAGAQAVQVFDTWGGILTPEDYATYALPYTKRVIDGLNRDGVPVIHYVGTGSTLLPLIKTAGSDVVGVDWRIDIGEARRILGPDIAVQGNFDPTALFAPIPEIQRRVKEILDRAGDAPGHIFNLGHGILPPTPEDHAKALIEAVHTYSRK
jgi:uroporphyrinogen decarboxylase